MTGRGATKREGMWSFTPVKRGHGKSFSHAERGEGGTTGFGVVFIQ